MRWFLGGGRRGVRRGGRGRVIKTCVADLFVGICLST